MDIRNQFWSFKEVTNHRGSYVQDCCEDKTQYKVSPEYRTIVGIGHIFLSYQRNRQSAVKDNIEDGRKDTYDTLLVTEDVPKRYQQ